MRTLLILMATIGALKACSGEDSFDNGVQSSNANSTPTPSPGSSPSPTPDSSPTPSPSPSPQSPAELFFNTNIKDKYSSLNCLTCHRQGGLGPVSILEYSSAKNLLVETTNLSSKENRFYKVVRKIVNHPIEDACKEGGDNHPLCKALQDWWKKEVTPEFFFQTAVAPKMKDPGKCDVCHGASGAPPLVEYAQVKAKLDTNKSSATNNLLINKAGALNSVSHGGSSTYQCADTNASPCKEFISWYQLLYP